MKDGFKAMLSLFLAFIVIMPLAIIGKIIGGGLLALYIFSPLYYLLAWKMKIIKNMDSKFFIHGLIPLVNIIGLYALLIIFIQEKILKGDIHVFVGENKKSK